MDMDMDMDKTFYTVTMARVLTGQGRYEAAARIYRYLLDQTPDQADLRQALDKVSSMLPEVSEQWHDVADLIERWVQLTLRHKALRQLQRIRLRIDSPF